MTTTFDPSTAYAQDWQWVDFIDTVTWERKDGSTVTGLKARFGDFDTPDLQAVAASLAFTNEASGVVVWQPSAADGAAPNVGFAPQDGEILRKSDGTGWMVRGGFIKSRFGHWSLGAEREVVNG